MASPSQVRLLIAEASDNRAHELDSVLRNAGISTRPEFCVDLDGAAEAATAHKPDIFLCCADLAGIDRVLPALREHQPELPIILLDASDASDRLTEGMALGATDVVFEGDRDRLLYVVRRELHHVCQRHQLVATRRALQEAERRCQLLLSNSEAAIAYVHEGMHIHANDDYLSLFGFESADDLLGLPLLDLIDAEHGDDFKAKMKAFRKNADELTFDFTGRTVDGAPVNGELTLSNAEYEGEACTQVTVRRCGAVNGEAHGPAEASAEAAEDAATSNGSASKGGLDDFVARLAAVATDPPLSAIVIASIDAFEHLQVEHGLQASIGIVDQVSHCLADAAQDSITSRISEHVFAIGLRAGRSDGNDKIAEGMRAAVEGALFETHGKTVRCTISLAAIRAVGDDQILVALDTVFRTLVAAQHEGKTNAVHWYKPEVPAAGSEQATDLDKRAMLENVNRAIDNDSFQLLFQPIISLRGDSDEHYEVFLRMLDDAGTHIRPDQFLQIAVDHGVAIKIDRWVILQSIKVLAAHRSKGHDTRLTINLSSNALHDVEFAQWLSVAIKAARLPSDAVIFQITEPDAASHMRQAQSFIKALKALHCRSSLSHFGHTKTAFDTLKRLGVDFVKMDRAMVQAAGDDTKQRKALTEMIRELQGLGKLTIVPMVESASEMAALWQAGANYVQGYYLQEPSAEMTYDFASDD